MKNLIETKELYESPSKEKNQQKYGDNENVCVCCNKPTNEEIFVHMSTDWKAVPSNISEEELVKNGMESQGLFPIGKSCAKKMGAKYIVKSF